MKISNNVTSPNFTSLHSSIGKAVKNSGSTVKKAIKKFEPNGGDNTFYGLASIMIGAVLIPRVITAAKRNPDNKEATKDEIAEILFRDVQTILIMLFGLKMLNSGIGNIATKLSGIPMVEEPLERIFKNVNSKGFEGFIERAVDFVKHPIERGKTLLKNIGKIVHPTGGSILSSGEKINSRFTNLTDYNQIKNFLKDVPNRGGDGEKVYQKIISSLIKKQDDFIASEKVRKLRGNASNENVIKQAQDLKEKLQKMLEKDGFAKFMNNESLDSKTEELMVDFFNDSNNDLARSARNVKDWLRMLALGIEVTYLGFGLPALNQKRLEKKYLSEKPIGEQRGDTFTPINDKHIKPQEVKLYGNFIK